MPPHSNRVLRYHSGKFPLCQAAAKLPNPNGPAGVSEAMSAGTPGRKDATAIQANGTAHSAAAAPATIDTATRPLAFIVDPALEGAERDNRQGQQRRDADHRGRRSEPIIVILRCLLIDVIEQEVGRVGGP